MLGFANDLPNSNDDCTWGSRETQYTVEYPGAYYLAETPIDFATGDWPGTSVEPVDFSKLGSYYCTTCSDTC
jgi:hypothetical protein